MKIAIMGGTFDPIHMAHLTAAEAVRDALQLDKVLFMPSGDPPHKQGSGVTSAENRYQMVCLATASNPAFEVSRIEIDRPGRTYTLDTIHALKETLPPDTKLYFIVGTDAFIDMKGWYHADELRYACSFAAVTRPGYEPPAVDDPWYQNVDYTWIEIPELHISSTDLRNRVRNGRSIRYLTDPAVEAYIAEHGLYGETL